MKENLPPNCLECGIYVVNENDIDNLYIGAGDLVKLQDAGIGFDFSGLAESIVSFTIEYQYGEGEIGIGANYEGINYADHPTSLPTEIASGVFMHLQAINNSGSVGTMTFYGDIQSIQIAGHYTYLDNGCFLTAPEGDFCMDLEPYQDLEEPLQLAEEGDAGETIYSEDGLKVRAAEIIYSPNEEGLLQNISITPEQLCDFAFDAADGPRWYLEGGIELDFSGFSSLPTFVRFDYAYCPGTDFVNFGANGEMPFYGFFAELPYEIADGVTTVVIPHNNAGTQGTIYVFGQIETLLIGGIPMHIDNICYNGIPEDEEVWPGDANSDNLAHHVDLLSVGLAFGSDGPARNDQVNEWDGLNAPNWDAFFANGVNYKHADCDGNGVVDEADLEAIAQNYGLTHGPNQDPFQNPGTNLDPPIMVEFPDPNNVPANTPFEVPVVLGTEEMPVNDIYGLAFTVNFDPELIDPNSIEVVYPTSWFGEPGINVIRIHRIFPNEGKIEIALSRNDQNNVSGYGAIVHIVGIIDDIAGIHNTQVGVELEAALDSGENPIPLGEHVQSLQIVGEKEEDNPIGRIDLRRGTRIFPNPTRGIVFVTNKYNLAIEEMELLDDKGQRLGRKVKMANEISLEGLPAGVYMLKMKVGEHIIHEKVVKM